MRCWYWSNERFRKMKSIKILNKRIQNFTFFSFYGIFFFILNILSTFQTILKLWKRKKMNFHSLKEPFNRQWLNGNFSMNLISFLEPSLSWCLHVRDPRGRLVVQATLAEVDLAPAVEIPGHMLSVVTLAPLSSHLPVVRFLLLHLFNLLNLLHFRWKGRDEDPEVRPVLNLTQHEGDCWSGRPRISPAWCPAPAPPWSWSSPSTQGRTENFPFPPPTLRWRSPEIEIIKHYFFILFQQGRHQIHHLTK